MIKFYSKEELAALSAAELNRLDAELRQRLTRLELTDDDHQKIIVMLDLIVRIQADQTRRPTLRP